MNLMDSHFHNFVEKFSSILIVMEWSNKSTVEISNEITEKVTSDIPHEIISDFSEPADVSDEITN